MAMRVYLDCCCLQRASDDQTQPRIRVETEALFAVLSEAIAGRLVMVSSDALAFEIAQTPDVRRQRDVTALLSLASETVSAGAVERAEIRRLEASGISGIDAVHLAVASAAKVDWFVTVDDRLRKRVQGVGCGVTSLLG